MILGKLTQGGMAEVYLAQQTGPGAYQKLCVVKRVRPHLAKDKDFVAMFTNEARLAAKINHPNVVQIFDLGQGGPSGADWFLTMEYLDGRDMLQIGRACRAHSKAVPFDVTARIISDACAGLDFAHQLTGDSGEHLNLVHRDMSPENILITFEGHVKVVDFGIAKAKDNAFRTQAGQIKGKLGYVAPEAILGKKLDARADIFAIGATLYLFLCGRPAFTGTNPMEVFERSLQPPTAPTEVNNRVPKALETVCLRCLAQDPKDRYQSGAELRAALEAYLESTGRPLGRAQLAQFMRILFPPGRDPQRQRVEGLIREGQALIHQDDDLALPDVEVTLSRAPLQTEAIAAPISNAALAPASVSGLVDSLPPDDSTAITTHEDLRQAAQHTQQQEFTPPPVDFASEETHVGVDNELTQMPSRQPFSSADDDVTREADASILRELSSVLDSSFEPTPPPLPTDAELDPSEVTMNLEVDLGDLGLDEVEAEAEAKAGPDIDAQTDLAGPNTPSPGDLEDEDPLTMKPSATFTSVTRPERDEQERAESIEVHGLEPIAEPISPAPPTPPPETGVLTAPVTKSPKAPKEASGIARFFAFGFGMVLGSVALLMLLIALDWLDPIAARFGIILPF